MKIEQCGVKILIPYANNARTDSDEQVIALSSDWSNCEPIVYGLIGDDVDVVYVGATRNPKRRFAYYRTTKNCHNKKLQQWLKQQNFVYVQILHRGLTGLFEAEKLEIKSRNGLFNMIGGGNQAWRDNGNKPWLAGIGVLCPSSIALRMMAISGSFNHKWCSEQVKSIKDKMTDDQRIVYEVNLAKLMPNNNRVKKWLSLTSAKMLSVLENNSYA